MFSLAGGFGLQRAQCEFATWASGYYLLAAEAFLREVVKEMDDSVDMQIDFAPGRGFLDPEHVLWVGIS